MRYDIKRDEDERYIYGDTWEGEAHITKWLIPKQVGKRMIPLWFNDVAKERSKEYKEAVIHLRREYINKLSPEKKKEFIDRLVKEGYDLYGETYD